MTALCAEHLRPRHAPLSVLFGLLVVDLRRLLRVVPQRIVPALQRDLLPLRCLNGKCRRRDFSDVCSVQAFFNTCALLPERIKEIPHLLHDLPVLLCHVLLECAHDIQPLTDIIHHALAVGLRPPVEGSQKTSSFESLSP